jgi:hypothetical protein
MAHTYLFFEPVRLPLEPHELSETTVRPMQDDAAVRASLNRVLPSIEWEESQVGRMQTDGHLTEFHLPSAGRTLSMRCSLRTDHAEFVQGLCNQLRWLAFDERPMCFQPGREPMAA